MSIQIKSKTVHHAADGHTLDDRTTIGVFEPIVFTAFRAHHPIAAHWTAPLVIPSAQLHGITTYFDTAGTYTVTAQTGGQVGHISLTVVEPSVRVHKVNVISVPSGLLAIAATIPPTLRPTFSGSEVGAAMSLQPVLTPLSVSFKQLQFRETPCMATNVWGYWSIHRPLFPGLYTHHANPAWSDVNDHNEVVGGDIASFFCDVSTVPLPLQPGGLSFHIPNQYRNSGESVIRTFAHPIPQAHRWDPSTSSPPFHGTFTVWKGGQQVIGAY